MAGAIDCTLFRFYDDPKIRLPHPQKAFPIYPKLPNLTRGPTPRTLAVETSSRHGSVAAAFGAQLLAENHLSPTQRHAVELMPAIEKLCLDQGWLTPNHPPRIDQLYLSLGPGSFTGLRIAVALARTLAQAIGCQIVTVPSLDVIAENAPHDCRTVIPILDAKRGQVFAAKYLRNGSTQLHCDIPPALVDPTTFLTAALQQSPDHHVAILGEGIDYHRPAIDAARQHGTITELPKDLWIPTAATLHKLAWPKAQRHEFADPATLLPIYIRLPEAEEVWRKKHQ